MEKSKEKYYQKIKAVVALDSIWSGPHYTENEAKYYMMPVMLKESSKIIELFYFGSHPPEAMMDLEYFADIAVRVRPNEDPIFVLRNHPDREGPVKWKLNSFSKDVIYSSEVEKDEDLKAELDRDIAEVQQELEEEKDQPDSVGGWAELEEDDQDSGPPEQVTTAPKTGDQEVTTVSGVGPKTAITLHEIGIATVKDLATYDPLRLSVTEGFGKRTVLTIINNARKLMELDPLDEDAFKQSDDSNHVDESKQRIDYSKETDVEKTYKEVVLQMVHQKYGWSPMGYTPEFMQYRASSVGQCPRKLTLDKFYRKYLDEDQIVRVHEIEFENQQGRDRIGGSILGQWIHEKIQTAFLEHDQVVTAEKKIKFKLGQIEIVGHYDLLINVPEPIVVDIKSHSVFLENYESLPIERHQKQLMLYQHGLGKIPGQLWYINRDNGEVKVFEQGYDDEMVMEMDSFFFFVSNSERRAEIVDIPDDYSKFDKPCKYGKAVKCKYWDYCWSESND